MTYGVYEVIGQRQYRGHKPGERFEAQLDPDAEWRAIKRGDIRLLERVKPELPAARRLPDDWPPNGADTAKQEAPRSASFT